MKQFLLAFLMIFGMGLQAQAFFVEPFLNYEMGENADNSNQEYTGTNLGVRAGGSTLGFFYGLEYGLFSGDVETTVASVTTKSSADGSDLGLTIGYDFPIMFRAYLTYFLMSDMEVGSTELEGSGGMRLGLGFTTLPFININLEMITRKYDKSNGNDSDTELEGYALGVSIPLP